MCGCHGISPYLGIVGDQSQTAHTSPTAVVLVSMKKTELTTSPSCPHRMWEHWSESTLQIRSSPSALPLTIFWSSNWQQVTTEITVKITFNLD